MNLEGGSRVAVLFMENLKRLKEASIPWAKDKKIREDTELLGIESSLSSKMEEDGLGFFSEGDKEELVMKEKCRRDILVERKEIWRLKSRAIWLNSGDENTKFFHAYAIGRKMKNTIWELNDDDGLSVSCFEGLSSLWVEHYKNLFTSQ